MDLKEWLPILTPFILVILTGIIFPLIRIWIAKIRDERLRRFAEIAIGQAEEFGAKLEKKEDTKPDSTVKHAMAKNKLIELAGKAGISVSMETADTLIESALGVFKLEGKR